MLLGTADRQAANRVTAVLRSAFTRLIGTGMHRRLLADFRRKTSEPTS